MFVKNKTIVVTGAGSGIGRAICLLLLHKQANVAAVDIHPEALEETQKLAKVDADRYKAFVLDISDKDKVNALPDQVVQHFGSADGLINNAGIIQKFIPVNELPMDEINKVFNVNFYGTLYMTKAFLPVFLKNKEAHLVNISSMGGFIPFPGQTIYGASKAAVKLLTEGLYAELRDTSVRVTVVHPGAVNTNITENSGLGKPKADANSNAAARSLTPTKAAEIIIKAMERNKFRATVGKDASLLDLLYRMSPRRATNFIGKMMKKSIPQ